MLGVLAIEFVKDATCFSNLVKFAAVNHTFGIKNFVI